MSFKHNDNDPIHLGNYEEFFILYMDNELSSEQMEMVDLFLAAHPDLRGEFELLMSIKLPSEKITMDKNELFADNMKFSAVDEELLLYLDGELDGSRSKVVEFELASNPGYHEQHLGLLKTKLDAGEKINYPNKKELYRKTERVIVFKMWMRVAAAVLIIAITGIFYFRKTSSIDPLTNNVANNNNGGKPKSVETAPNNTSVIPQEKQEKNNPDLAVNSKPVKSNVEITRNKVSNDVLKKDVEQMVKNAPPQQETAQLNENINAVTPVERNTGIIETHTIEKGLTAAIEIPNKEILNNQLVTSASADTYNKREDSNEGLSFASEKKGSVKGFLRRATRLIEKRTGFDPTNDNGQLLIGAVALNLK